jgi:MFS family permease
MTAFLRRRRSGADPQDEAFDRRLIAPMILGAILNPINSTMLAVALVPIGVAFGAPASDTAWLVTGLYLATAVGQPVVGRLIDLYGPRRLYLVGSVLIGVGGVLGTLAPALGVLVVARVLIGFGTCAGYPAAMHLIRSEAQRTGKDSPQTILTILAVSTQTVAVIGPTLGGLLIAVGGWHATFLVNVPLAVACLVLGAWRLPKEPLAERSARTGLAGRIDLAGIVGFTVTLVALLLFLVHPEAGLWFLPVLAVAAGAGLVWWELRASSPFLDLRLLGGNGPLLATYARSLLTAVSSYSLLYGFTQWLEEGPADDGGLGLDPSLAGLVLLPVFGTGILVSTLTGRRPEIRGKLLVGAVTQVVVAGLLLTLGPTSAVWLVVVVALVAGVPQGLNNLANQNAVYHQATPERIGSSAGLLRTFYYLGAIVASTAGGAFLSPRADTAGLHDLAWFMLGAAVLFVIVTLADRSLGDFRSHGREVHRENAGNGGSGSSPP